MRLTVGGIVSHAISPPVFTLFDAALGTVLRTASPVTGSPWQCPHPLPLQTIEFCKSL